MSDLLPEGFVLDDAPAAPTGSALPDGFVLDDPAPATGTSELATDPGHIRANQVAAERAAKEPNLRNVPGPNGYSADNPPYKDGAYENRKQPPRPAQPEATWLTDLQSGWNNLMSGFAGTSLESGAKNEADTDRAIDAMKRAGTATPEQIAYLELRKKQIQQDQADAAQTLAIGAAKQAQLPPTPESVQRFNNATGWMDALSAFAADPYTISRSTILQSAPASIPSALGGIMGSILGPMGSSMGAGGGSYITELGGAVQEGLQRFGADMNDPASIMQVWSQHKAEISKYAQTRATVVGGADALTAGISSKFAGVNPADQIIKGNIKRELLGIGIEAPGGMVGEAGAQLATEGRINQPGQVLAEGLGEVVPGAVQVAGSTIVQRALKGDREAAPQTPPPQPQQPAPGKGDRIEPQMFPEASNQTSEASSRGPKASSGTPSDDEVLHGAGYTPQQIAEMHPAEKAQEAADARAQGVQPKPLPPAPGTAPLAPGFRPTAPVQQQEAPAAELQQLQQSQQASSPQTELPAGFVVDQPASAPLMPARDEVRAPFTPAPMAPRVQTALYPPSQADKAFSTFFASKTPITPEALAKASGMPQKDAVKAIQRAALRGSIIQTRQGRWMRAPTRVKPISAMQFIASIGGISDPTGELAGMDLPKMGPYGPVVRKTGLHPDKVREALVEAGYMRDPGVEAGGQATTTVNDVYALLDNEMRGQKAYQPQDQARADALDTQAKNDALPPDYQPVHHIAQRFGMETWSKVKTVLDTHGLDEGNWSTQELSDAARMVTEGQDPEDALVDAAVRFHEDSNDPESQFPEVQEWMRARHRDAMKLFDNAPPFPDVEPENDRQEATVGKGEGRSQPGSKGEGPRAQEDARRQSEEASVPRQDGSEGQGQQPAPAVEQGADNKPQTVLPGAEQTTPEQAKAAAAKEKARKELEIRQRQSKLRKSGQQSVEDQEGGMFAGEGPKQASMLDQATEQSSERETYPDGRWKPRLGDKVYQRVPGMFGTPASITGFVRQDRDGTLVVKMEAGTSLIGGKQSMANKRAVPLSPAWTVVDDPQPARREAEAKAKQDAETQKWKDELRASDEAARKSAQDAIAAGASALTPENAKVGLEVFNHRQNQRQIIGEIGDFKEGRVVFTRPVGEEDEAPRSNGPMSYYSIPKKETAPQPEAEEKPADQPKADAAPDDRKQAILSSRNTSDDGSSFAATVMRELAKVDDLFQNPRSDAKTLDGVIGDIVFGFEKIPNVPISEAERALGAVTKSGWRNEDGFDFFVLEDGDGQVWMDISNFAPGLRGSAPYAAVANYAHNAGKVFIGDPSGLSNDALRRRTEAMLSSAIKFGTTRHLEPHKRQLEGDPDLGIPPMEWTYGDDAANVASLINASIANTTNLTPEIANARFDFDTGTFRNAQGQRLSDEILDGWRRSDRRIREARASYSTIRRGIFLKSLAQAERGERPRLLEQALRELRQLVESGDLKATLYNRPSQSRVPPNRYRYTISPQQEAELTADIQSTAKRILGRHLVGVEVRRDLSKEFSAEEDAVYDPNTGLIWVALQGKQNPRMSIRHEAIHALRNAGVFTKQEWAALTRMAHGKWIEQYDIRARYERLYRERFDLSEAQIQELIVEEAIAEGYAEHVALERDDQSVAGRIFTRLRQFLEALRYMLAGRGYTSVDQIIRGVDEGQFGRRSARAGQGRDFLLYAKQPQQDRLSTAQSQDVTKTEAFRKWFGDSKVVNEQGAPLVVYHGTTADFTQFKPGSYFSADRSEAGAYSFSSNIARNEKASGKYTVIQAPEVYGHTLEYYGTISDIDNPSPGHFYATDQGVVQFKGKGRWNLVSDAVVDYSQFNEDDMTIRVKAGDNSTAAQELFTDYEALVNEQYPVSVGGNVMPVYLSIKNPIEMPPLEGNQLGERLGADPASVAAKIAELKAQGYDGIVTRSDDAYYRINGEEPPVHYIPFDPEQIKSVFNRGTFDPNNQSILSSRGYLKPPKNAAPGSFDEPHDERVRRALFDSTDTLLNRIRRAGKAAGVEFARKMQDREIDLKRTQNAIEKASGPIIEPQDAYLAASLYPGRVAQRDRNIVEEKVKPLVDEIAKRGLSVQDVDDFARAQHAFERNAYIASISKPGTQFHEAGSNPAIVGGSGLSDDQAQAILDDFRRSGKFRDAKAMADRVVAMNRETLDKLLTEGLIEQDTYDALTTRWKHYVPLRGEDNATSEDHPDSPRTGRRYDIRGKEFQSALGRDTISDSPLAYSIMQARQANIRIEKNRVGKRLLRLAQANPNEGFWQVNRRDMKRVLDKRLGYVRNVNDIGTTQAENVFAVKVGGKTYHITIHHEGLLKAMKGIGAENMHGLFLAFHKINRLLAALNTSYDPEFLFRNFVRDLQQTGIVLQEEQRAGLTRSVVGDIRKAAAGMNRMLQGDLSTQWARYAREYADAGGKMGFMDRNDIIAEKENIEKLMRQLTATGWKKAAQLAKEATFDRLERWNDSLENTLRLSTYVNLRRMGVSQDKAAMAARDLTVNFNRKGEWGPAANSLYLFFNASMQGAANMSIRLARSKRMRQVAVGIIAMGFLQDLINRMIAGDDDDDKNRYDKIPNEVKSKNGIIMLPKWAEDEYGVPYLKWPLPLGYNIFHYLGTEVGHAISGVEGHGPLEAASNILGVIGENFNPLGQGGSLTNFFAPTLLDPLVDIETNKDWFGEDIVPKTFDEKQPWAERYNPNINWVFKAITDTLSSATGGSPERPGKVDWSPEWVEHVWDFAAGGVGRLVNRAATTAQTVISGDEPDANKMPFVRVFTGQGSKFVDRDAYYEIRDAVEITEKELKARMAEKDLEAVRRVRQTYDREIRMIGTVKAAEKQLGKLRKQYKAAKNMEGLDETARQKRLDFLSKRMDELQLKVRKQWNDLGEETTAPASAN